MLMLVDKVKEIADKLYKELTWEDIILYDEEGITNIYDIMLREPDLEVYTGATKTVIVPNSSSVVVKIPISGVFIVGFDDEHGYSYDEEKEYRNAKTVNREGSDWDYVEEELYVYNRAVADGFREFFPSTSFYCKTKAGIPLYLQEKVTPFYKAPIDFKTLRSSETYTLAKSINEKNEIRINPEFLTKCLEYYGEEKTKKFIEYITVTYREIGKDLHSENIGINNAGAPVILDFCGYREN